MKSTSPLAVNGTPENQRTAAIGADESVRPKSWSYMHRAKWARSLPVKSGARLTAIAIADHINEKTGWWDLSAAQMADETGQGERTVRRHVNEDLRPYFGVQDRPGFMWRFTMPRPLMAVVEPRPNRPDPPAKLADVPCKRPSKYVHPPARLAETAETPALPEHLEAVEAGNGVKCRRCSHMWPRAAGLSHMCVGRSERAAEPPERTERPQRTRRGRTSDSVIRSGIIDAERRARRAERGESWA